MKKGLFWLLLAVSLAAAAVPTRAGNWTFSGKVGVTQKSNDVGLQGGIIAEYKLSSMLSWRTDLDFVFADLSDLSLFKLSVPTNLLLYPMGTQAVVVPYVGPGLNIVVPYNEDLAAGFNGVFGVRFQLPKKPVFGLEGRYTVPDAADPQVGDFAVALTGTWQLQF